MKYPIVSVVWEDHCQHGGSWVQFGDVDNRPVVIHSVGYLIHSDRKYISLASCVCSPQMGKGTFTVIRSCIKDFKIIRKAK